MVIDSINYYYYYSPRLNKNDEMLAPTLESKLHVPVAVFLSTVG